MIGREEQIRVGYDEVADRIGMPAKFYVHCLSVAGKVGGKILDAGCGQGSLRDILLERWPSARVYGCDISFRLCLKSASKCSTTSVVQADVQQLPYRDGVFDHVFMTEVLEHLLNAKNALLEVHRVLKRAGRLLISIPNRDWFHYTQYEQVRKRFQPVDDYWFGAEEIKTLLREAGFRLQKLRGGENLYFGGGVPRLLEKIVLLFVPWLHERSKRLIIFAVRQERSGESEPPKVI